VRIAANRLNLLFYKEKKLKTLDSLYTLLVEAAQKSYNEGDTPYLDVLLARSESEQIKVERNQLKSAISKTESGLNALLQSDSLYSITPSAPAEINPDDKVQAWQQMMVLASAKIDQSRAMLAEERNNLFPDLTLSWFNGTNSFAGAKNYYGYEAGIAIPLIYGGQRSRIKSARLETQIVQKNKEDMEFRYRASKQALTEELNQYRQAIDYYNNRGRLLSEEIIRSSLGSYREGESDFFRLVKGMESAARIELGYLENLDSYNRIILELNYLILN